LKSTTPKLTFRNREGERRKRSREGEEREAERKRARLGLAEPKN
jgi:hypothetical protein